MIRRLLAMTLACALTACGGGSDPATGVATLGQATASAAPVTEPARKASASIGPRGGEVTVVSAAGVVSTLIVPPGALAQNVEISLTPIADLRIATLSRGFVGAVQMEPSGLSFQRPATLRIGGAPTLRSGELLTGVGSANDGSALRLKLAVVVNGAIELPIEHFSNAGAATATPAELAQLPPAPAPTSRGEDRDALFDQTFRLPWDVATNEQLDVALATIFRDFYLRAVKPRLVDVTSTPPLETFSVPYLDALLSYDTWLAVRARTNALSPGLNVDAVLSGLDAEARPLAAAMLRAEIDRAISKCVKNASTRFLAFAVDAQQQAGQFGLATEGFGLSTAALGQKVNECLRPVLDPIRLPATLSTGTPASLDAQAKIVFNGRPDPVGAPFVFTVESTSATLQRATGASDAQGRYTTVFTPTADAVQFTVRACLVLDLLGDGGSDFCVSQSVSSRPGLAVLEGNLSRSRTVAAAGDFGASQEDFTGFLRIGVDGANSVTVLDGSGATRRQGSEVSICFDFDRRTTETRILAFREASVVEQVTHGGPLVPGDAGSSFVFLGVTTRIFEQFVDSRTSCAVETKTFVGLVTPVIVLPVLAIERDAGGRPSTITLGRGVNAPAGTVENLRLVVGS